MAELIDAMASLHKGRALNVARQGAGCNQHALVKETRRRLEMVERKSYSREFCLGELTGALLTPSIPPMKKTIEDIRASGRQGSSKVIACDGIAEVTLSGAQADYASMRADEGVGGSSGGAVQLKGGSRHG